MVTLLSTMKYLKQDIHKVDMKSLTSAELTALLHLDSALLSAIEIFAQRVKSDD